MFRPLGLLTSLVFFFSFPLAAQEERAPAHVYEAYYRVDYADLEEWEQRYRDYSVPVLNALFQDEVIEGWSYSQHHTGGHYNVRFAVRTYDWPSIETFWDEYLAQLEAAMSADDWTSLSRMILEHRDEIWNIGDVNVPEDLAFTYMYASEFTVGFADVEEWNSTWSDLMADFIEEAADEDLSVGWVRLDHNTGGPHNSKHLLLFESWDDIDNFVFDRVIGMLMEEQPELWTRLNELFDTHDDVVWAVPQPDIAEDE